MEKETEVKTDKRRLKSRTKIKEAFGITVPYWTDSLKSCINNLKHG